MAGRAYLAASARLSEDRAFVRGFGSSRHVVDHLAPEVPAR
jgi:hypothetical protein